MRRLPGTFSYIAFSPSRGAAVFTTINKSGFSAAMAEVSNELVAMLATR